MQSDIPSAPASGAMTQNKTKRNRKDWPYYVARFRESGRLNHSDKRKQFIIPVDSEVRFQLDVGHKISRGAKLLINKPKRMPNGEVEYTITQPLENDDGLGDEFEQEKLAGSQLDTEYLEMLEPHAGTSQYQLEYRVHFPESGSFFVQLAYEDEIDSSNILYSQPQYINVEPRMKARGQEVRVKELSLMTVMSRCLGKMSRWPQVLRNVRELGYNAVHFTPIQQYGESFSHYSIAGQTTVDDYYFEEPAKMPREQRLAQLKSTLDGLRSEGLLSVVDIVLNHTANDSKWIVDHPDAAYNTDDCPHLYSAWVLDKAIQDFSLDYAHKKIHECPSAPYISNAGDLAAVMKALQNRVLGPLKLHEYFLCDVQKVVREVFRPAIQDINQAEIEKYKKKFEKKGWFLWNHFDLIRDHLTVGHGSGPQRMNVQLKMPDAAMYFLLANNRNRDNATKEVERLLCSLNDDWMRRCGEYMKEAYGALEGNIRYFKTEIHQSHITAVNRLVEPYFSELKNEKKTKVAHNGWVMGHNCMEDFGMVGWHYLRRTINIWADNIKLRYGSCPADSPYLWEHMTKYCQDMASVADGFRLDNTHSTPIHVCQYLLQAARSKNKNLFVMAELFTNSSELDAMFCQKLNLNGLVREMQNRYDTGSLGAYFHHLTCQDKPVGCIDDRFTDLTGRPYKTLKASKPDDMIYDCTHDNESPLGKFQTGRIALPHIGLSSLADCSVASTWGIDFLMKDQIHCVSEKRLYPIYDQSGFVVPEQIEKEGPAQQEDNQATSFEHEFVLNFPSARKVAVAGDFNGWKPNIFLDKDGGQWKAKITLPIDSRPSYQYKFVVNDSDWVLNPSAPTAKDSRGKDNNVVTVPGKGGFSMSSSLTTSGAPQEKCYEDIRYARMMLNRVHTEATRLNAEIFMHQQAEDVLVVTRQFELDKFSDFDSYVSISRFCFYNKGGAYNYATSIELPGFMTECVFAAYVEIPDSVYGDARLKDKEFLYGPRGCKVMTYNYLDGKFCHREKISEEKERLNFFFMPPSFTCVIKVKSRTYVKEAVQKLNSFAADPRLDKVFVGAPQSALNHVLFRCEHEEHDISAGKRGVYGLKSTGQFPYAGIVSFIHILNDLKLSKDLGAELFDNIRAGNWLVDYTQNRIREYSQIEPSIGLNKLADLLEEQFGAVKQLPAGLKPKYVSKIMESVYNAVVKEIMGRRILDDFFADSDDLFVKKMSLAIYQMYARVPSVYFKNHKDSMCAGLPHFSTGYMRCWGRDTFIALRGLMVVTGLEDEARDVILFFAKVMRHGLLPNLHDGGGNTRFNSRDAPWFFLQAIKDYCIISEEGLKFLDHKFELHFRDDDQAVHQRKTSGRVLTILEMIVEICQRHCQGIEFREWNAGTAIDAHMKDGGFNVKIHCSETTGFCFGGNKDNCGTWMDKMGSSWQNKGVPATPRDGAPIELVAMQFSILTWLADLHKEGKIPMGSVRVNKKGVDKDVRFDEWAAKMKEHFERCFWVPESPSEDHQHDIDKSLVNRRGIYKDVYGSADRYTDYQLRCNIPIAMSYAPELFNRKHAQVCITNIANILMEKGCMGIKTLDPKDRNYNGDYINSDDTAGWNYHQGPEWVWPVGFFLKAQLLFHDYKSKEEARFETMKWLIPHRDHIVKDKWEGLPELTNSHGQYCADSCETQAWSISTLIDAMRDLHYYGEEEGIQMVRY